MRFLQHDSIVRICRRGKVLPKFLPHQRGQGAHVEREHPKSLDVLLSASACPRTGTGDPVRRFLPSRFSSGNMGKLVSCEPLALVKRATVLFGSDNTPDGVLFWNLGA